MEEKIKIDLLKTDNIANTDIEKSIYELQMQLDKMSNKSDKMDYFVAVASGILTGMIDVLWVEDFSLENGRNEAEEKVDKIVIKISKAFGCESDNIQDAVRNLERKFGIPSDRNMKDFGGSKYHHLKDFAHHPSIIGLIFSLLTQFTEKSFGIDKYGIFKCFPINEKSKIFIGKDIPDKIIKGTIIWFFHLVSDIAGSNKTAGNTGGTGIPGPILSLAEEFSKLPIIRYIKGKEVDEFLKDLFEGKILAKKDENGKIIKETMLKFDLRGELGVFIELGKQATPVIANESIVRIFYFLRRLLIEIKEKKIYKLNEIGNIEWENVKPYKNATLTRMLTISTGVFTGLDITSAFIFEKGIVSVNYVGVGRFSVAVGSEITEFLRIREINEVKKVYEKINENTYTKKNNESYENLGKIFEFEEFGLNLEQTEILYNIEYLKILNDIEKTNVVIQNKRIVKLKEEWLKEWKNYISIGFPEFINEKNAKLNWYNYKELIEKIEKNNPSKEWLRLILLEAMLFEPYYTLSFKENKKEKMVPSKKYKDLQNKLFGYNKDIGDEFLNNLFGDKYCKNNYIKRIRKSYNKLQAEYENRNSKLIKGISITALATILIIITGGNLAPKIAVTLVGSNFTGLSGAALTNACLAYLGGGAIAAGGLGMAGGTMTIVGGSAILSAGIGTGISSIAFISTKQATNESIKLMTAINEIFLNDEYNIELINKILEQYKIVIEAYEQRIQALYYEKEKDNSKKVNEELKEMKKTLKVLKKVYKDMQEIK